MRRVQNLVHIAMYCKVQSDKFIDGIDPKYIIYLHLPRLNRCIVKRDSPGSRRLGVFKILLRGLPLVLGESTTGCGCGCGLVSISSLTVFGIRSGVSLRLVVVSVYVDSLRDDRRVSASATSGDTCRNLLLNTIYIIYFNYS